MHVFNIMYSRSFILLSSDWEYNLDEYTLSFYEAFRTSQAICQNDVVLTYRRLYRSPSRDQRDRYIARFELFHFVFLVLLSESYRINRMCYSWRLCCPSISTSNIDYRRPPSPVSISAKFILGYCRVLSARAGRADRVGRRPPLRPAASTGSIDSPRGLPIRRQLPRRPPSDATVPLLLSPRSDDNQHTYCDINTINSPNPFMLREVTFDKTC